MTDAGSTDEYAAIGTGAENFEAPAVFYLTHMEAIERWHGLRDAAVAATAGFLDTIFDDFELPDSKASWSVTVADTGGYRHHLVAPEHCPPAADGTPAIAACFGWHTKRVTISTGSYVPFVGVRIGAGPPLAGEWRQEFLRGTGSRALDIRNSRGYHAAGEWPAWKDVTASGRWWESLDSYRSQALAAVGRCIDDFGPDIERTLAAMTSR